MKSHANNFVDRTGMVFGNLKVVGFSHRNKHGQSMWLCRCKCGNKTKVQGATLAGGRQKSCGCKFSGISKSKTTHGESKGSKRTDEYVCWLLLRSRCHNPKYQFFHRYGGRGITVCKRWNKFENFLTDMGRRPSKKHSIDRKNNDGNYTPKNCRWATKKQQANNKS